MIISKVHGCMFDQFKFTGASIFDRRCSRVHVWSVMVPGCVFGQKRLKSACLVSEVPNQPIVFLVLPCIENMHEHLHLISCTSKYWHTRRHPVGLKIPIHCSLRRLRTIKRLGISKFVLIFTYCL